MRWTIAAVTVPVHDVLADSRAALRVGDAERARCLLEGPDADPTSGAVLEGLAQASYLQFQFGRCVEEWERAYAAHRRFGDHVGAVRVARTVACVHLMILGNGAVAADGLPERRPCWATRLTRRRQGVALDIGMFEGDRSRKVEHFRQALTRAEAPVTPTSSSLRSPISHRAESLSAERVPVHGWTCSRVGRWHDQDVR